MIYLSCLRLLVKGPSGERQMKIQFCVWAILIKKVRCMSVRVLRGRRGGRCRVALRNIGARCSVSRLSPPLRPAACALSADKPQLLLQEAGHMRRSAPPWGCLLPPCPGYILHRQAAHIVLPLFSCQNETFTRSHQSIVGPFVFTAPVSRRRATSVREWRGKKKKPTRSLWATSCRQIRWANSQTELDYCVRASSFINHTGNSFS